MPRFATMKTLLIVAGLLLAVHAMVDSSPTHSDAMADRPRTVSSDERGMPSARGPATTTFDVSTESESNPSHQSGGTLPPLTITRHPFGGETVIEPSVVYNFQSEFLRGEIRAGGPQPGVVRCRHKPTGYETVPHMPLHALLMPEWLLKPGNGRKGIFWPPVKAVPRVSVDQGSIVFHVAAKQMQDWNMDVTFRYTPARDWIDFECKIVPHVQIKDFEIFIASYVIEDMESTWVSAAMPSGEQFRKIDCRKTVPWGSVYTVARDAVAKAYLLDGRWDLPPREAGRDLWQDYHFARPILIAMKETTGLAVVTMVDPKVCSLLAGQHHSEETAHDFAFNTDLMPGQPFVGRARVVVRRIGAFPDAAREVDALWREFAKSLAK